MKKCVLVTGACINTGVDIVNKFLESGHVVVFTGRDQDKVDTALSGYKARYEGSEVYGYAINSLLDDNTVDEQGVAGMFEYLDKQGLVVDTLVLNAADLGVNQKIFLSPLSDFVKVINTNIVWDYCLVEQASRRMRDIGGGNIVFINSNTSYRAIPDRIAYEASKSGQLGMMRGLALDLGKYNIRVNAVLPGMIRTDRWDKTPEVYAKCPSRFTPIGDVAEGRDIADAVYYFATMARNTTGAELTVDGGNTIQLYPIIPEE